jgi:hypothetical protein
MGPSDRPKSLSESTASDDESSPNNASSYRVNAAVGTIHLPVRRRAVRHPTEVFIADPPEYRTTRTPIRGVGRP